MMQQDTIYAKLGDVFEDVFDDAVALSPDLTAEDVDGWDSITHIRLILAIEEEFDIKFAAAEVGEPKNIGDLVEIIERKL
jgi:acyl carrier protein